MEEDELLDGLIVGTPTINLRTQAKLQRFENRGRMLRAFADIMLPTRAAGSNKMQSSQSDPASKKTRCYNCNGKGHWARECAKLKRTPGTFYGRGAADHFINGCLQNKKQDVNNYVRLFKIFCFENFNLIKHSVVARNIKLEPQNETYFGLNKSLLKSEGKILCFKTKKKFFLIYMLWPMDLWVVILCWVEIL